MRNIKILFFLFALAIFSTSCKDECKDVNCLNGGICDEGICDCPVGFVGENCEQKVNFNITGVKDTIVYVNDTTNVPITVTWVEGPKETVNLSVTDLPANVTANILPNTGTPDYNATLQLIGGTNATTGTYNNVNVVGTIGSGLTVSKNFNIKVQNNCRPFLLGTYTITDSCTSGNYNYQSIIYSDPINTDRIRIDNFGSNTNYDIYLLVDCDAKTVTIPAQPIPGAGATVTGNGTFNLADESLVVNYKIQFASFAEECKAYYIKL